MTRLRNYWSPIEFLRGVGFMLCVFAGLWFEREVIHFLVRMFD